MERGRRCGRESMHAGIGWFAADEGGYTTVAVAVTLLVSISLVFCLAASEWTLSRSTDVQPVADAAALAGSNVVGAFCTIAQVVDACVLSLGLVGVCVLGAGLIASAIPGIQGFASEAMDLGKQILDARRDFARTAVRALQQLERALPVVVVANSYACVRANGGGGISYTGCALPFPLESRSNYASLESDVDADEIEDAAEDLQDATRRAQEAKERAEDARERAWRADCVDEPSCLSSRAQSLAGMGGSDNPTTSTPEEWDFGMPIERSRTYYARRFADESPDGGDANALTNSKAREAFYAYALEEVNEAYCYEDEDGYVDMWLPHLARNASEVRQTHLYTDADWPCTDEEGTVVLHSTMECPGAKGEFCGFASVADIEQGGVAECDTCRMGVGDLGRVASISTSATNGFEHYWQIIVEESQDYQKARNDQADAEKDQGKAAREGKGAFDRIIDQLRVPRPRICPPGAWGCVSVTTRDAGVATPSLLLSAFLSGTRLPEGVAVSAATLAFDDAAQGNDVLSRFFDGMAVASPSAGGLLGRVCGLWGSLLVSYGSSWDHATSAFDGFFDGIDGVFGGTVGSWLKGKLKRSLQAAGFEPADVRARKPVLTATADVLGKAGFSAAPKIRQLIQSLPTHGSAYDIVSSIGAYGLDGVQGDSFTIAELPIPGTGMSVPLTISLSAMGGAA